MIKVPLLNDYDVWKIPKDSTVIYEDNIVRLIDANGENLIAPVEFSGNVTKLIVTLNPGMVGSEDQDPIVVYNVSKSEIARSWLCSQDDLFCIVANTGYEADVPKWEDAYDRFPNERDKTWVRQPSTSWCCEKKCFQPPSCQVDGIACSKCESYSYCCCRCETYQIKKYAEFRADIRKEFGNIKKELDKKFENIKKEIDKCEEQCFNHF